MTRKKTTGKATRTRHSAAYKAEALKLAESRGVAAAAKELGLHESQLYGWRSKARLQLDRGVLEQQQATEIVRLKRQLAEQAEELAIVKKTAVHSTGRCNLYSRQVIGWAMSERMTAELVCEALRMALWRRHMPRGVLVHSDCGSQYCSETYQALLARHELVCSMSGKGNCYDAVAESFFHTLKVELIHGERFASRSELRQTVFEYVEIDYNQTRRHSANGYLSPAVFEAQQVA